MNAYIPSRAPAVALTGVLFVCFVALTNGPARGQGIEPPAPIQRVSIDDLTERPRGSRVTLTLMSGAVVTGEVEMAKESGAVVLRDGKRHHVVRALAVEVVSWDD